MVYPNNRAGMEATSVDKHVDQILSRARVLVVAGNSSTDAFDSCISSCSLAGKPKPSRDINSFSIPLMDAIPQCDILAYEVHRSLEHRALYRD